MEEEEIVQTRAIRVNGVPTVASFVGDVSASSSEMCLVLIPGNPGIIEFYEVFLERLYNGANGRLPVVGVSHAGHSPVWCYADDQSSYKEACGKSLNYQVQHKIDFLAEHIPQDCKIVLIGHSVGCWIVLQMLDDQRVADRVVKSVLLFPAVERLGATPNGRFWKPVSLYCRYPFALAAFALSWSPSWFKHLAISWRLKQRRVPHTLRSAGMHCMSYSFMHNALLMAAHEMRQIGDIDPGLEETILRCAGDVMFYYGSVDRWAPKQFYYDQKKKFPSADIRLCQKQFEHDFVLDSSEGVAHVVLDYLSECNLITRENNLSGDRRGVDCLSTVGT